MDPRLIEVARNGDIDALYALLGADPFILENVEKTPFTNTPLHWAVLAGHTCFVEEIANLKPSFTLKLNQDGFSPLHLASISGHLEIVKVLLKDEVNVDGGLCTLKGREKRTPLHCATIAGQVDVMEVLLSNCPNSIKALTVRKETPLHLAVKFGPVEAFKVLMNWIENHWHNDVLRQKDQEGNTVLHLATSRGQYEILQALLDSSSLLVRNAVQVNARNNEGLTALDLLMHLPSGPDREKMGTILYCVGAKKDQDIGSQLPERTSVIKRLSKLKIKYVFRYLRLKVEMDTPNDTRNALLVVVVLIVTATYQTGLNPPGGYWADDSEEFKSTKSDDYQDAVYKYHYAGQPIWSTKAPEIYNLVMLFNFAGFLLSLVLLYNLTVGFPLRGPLLAALFCMLLTHSWSTPISYNGPASGDDQYTYYDPWWSGNMMLWLPVVLVVVIWAITSSWMGRIWWKFLILLRRKATIAKESERQ